MTSFSNFFFSKLLLNCQYASSELLIRQIALETPPPPCPIISVTLQNRRCDILTMIGQLCGGKKEVRVWTSFNLIVHSLHNCFCYFMRTTEWKTLIFFQERFLNDNACLPHLWNNYKHFLILMWSDNIYAWTLDTHKQKSYFPFCIQWTSGGCCSTLRSRYNARFYPFYWRLIDVFVVSLQHKQCCGT